MADLSKIKLNGTTYNFKDATARTLINSLHSFEVEVVSSLPTSNIGNHTIYFVPQAVNTSVHDEYMYINNSWELIGTTSVDLSGYLQSSDIADWAKAANKPSYTATEVGAMASTHAAAAITSTDISNWNAKSNFSGSYTDLTDKPTIPAATTITNTLASGTLIATINGTNIYAPSYINGDNLAYGGE